LSDRILAVGLIASPNEGYLVSVRTPSNCFGNKGVLMSFCSVYLRHAKLKQNVTLHPLTDCFPHTSFTRAP